MKRDEYGRPYEPTELTTVQDVVLLGALLLVLLAVLWVLGIAGHAVYVLYRWVVNG